MELEYDRAATAQQSRHATRTAPAIPRPLGEHARALNAEPTVPATLDRIADLAVRAVDGCQHASVTRIGRGGPQTAAATGALPRRLDDLQYSTGDGPCLQAVARDRLCVSADLAAERRWRGFAAGAAAAGVRSVLSCRLYVGEETLGSLNLYAGDPDAFVPAVLPAAEAYAAVAAAALARADAAEQVVQLRRAVDSNRTIGIAIGMLMSSRRISEAEAFDLLRVASQHTNRKLRDIAAGLVRRRGVPA